MKVKDTYIPKIISSILFNSLLILSGIFTSPNHNLLTSLLLILGAAGSYFYMVFAVADRNWFDVRAVFSGVWMFTLGLATLRLAEYQKPWAVKTWILLAVGYGLFELGANLGLEWGPRAYEAVSSHFRGRKQGRCYLHLEPERYFPLCVTVTLLGLLCFLSNVAIKGFIPCFSADPNAYMEFYTKFHVFSVAATTVSGLCYYTIKTQSLTWWKKGILWMCIFYLDFLFPIMVVSRGVFVVAALSLTVTVFYLNKKRLWVLFLCMAMILGVYQFTSGLRSYTDAQLNVFFEPKEITIGESAIRETTLPETTLPETTGCETTLPETTVSETVPAETASADPTVPEAEEEVTFTLSPKMSFLYGYLTVSHDNFNEEVKNLQGYTWGCRMFRPFNVILRLDRVDEIIQSSEHYQVNPYLNTTNMFGTFYYDFHEIGIIIFVLLWSAIFGAVQGIYEKYGQVFVLLLLGYTMGPPTLSFFASWVDGFEFWMFCGTVILLAAAASVHLKKKTDEER